MYEELMTLNCCEYLEKGFNLAISQLEHMSMLNDDYDHEFLDPSLMRNVKNYRL